MVEEKYIRIGEKLKLLREQKNWSQRKLSEKSGVGPNSVGSYESGKHEPTYFAVECLLQAMGYRLVIERIEE